MHAGVREFSTEVEAADEAENFAQRSALRLEALSERKASGFAEEQLGSLAGYVCGREKKNAMAAMVGLERNQVYVRERCVADQDYLLAWHQSVFESGSLRTCDRGADSLHASHGGPPEVTTRKAQNGISVIPDPWCKNAPLCRGASAGILFHGENAHR